MTLFDNIMQDPDTNPTLFGNAEMEDMYQDVIQRAVGGQLMFAVVVSWKQF